MSLYWAAITVATIGYGDVTPTTTATKIVGSGSIGPAFQYLISHGVVEEKYYPYVDNDKGSCKASSLFFLPSYKITGYEGLPTNTNDTAIMDAIFTKGPVLAYIYSNNKVFKNYSGGIIRNLFPNSTFFDHAIVIVGWGTSSDGVDYWILRNSWSTNWGEQGYARLERHHGLIGINQYVYYVKM
ncbi:PREDICTED: thiol protease SEN102-like [Rhagoletis zephyria]|uniref:thiol protease SEN102-like n=1 Tax=Rhagoletis zephyria TaxID=28612 RepID=UPI00081184EC|nr:PREDICTED: thiol protease SEN102-like [Rhagoletis zephyria]